MKAIDGWISAPKGFVASGIKAGIKKSGKEDIAIIASQVPASTGAVFTKNIMSSPAVFVSRETAKEKKVRAVVINAGCANACTGDRGFADAKKMAQMTAELLNAKENEVYVCSTGVIGMFLPMDKVEDGIKKAYAQLSESGGVDAAHAIMTTDTFEKRSAYEVEIDGKKVTVAGIAKGSGMIHPNMATMLAFVTTDAAVDDSLIKIMVKEIADRTFNMVVVDGDTSTNDSLIVMANGMAGNSVVDSKNHPDYQTLYNALLKVNEDLAKLIARDGEGATKFLEVKVTGTDTFDNAKNIAMAIAKSPLVKTAFFGQDPNWGRIVCAAGYAGVDFDPNNVRVSLNNVLIFADNMSVSVDPDKLKAVMQDKDIVIDVIVGSGKEGANVWTCDFSYDYVKINAEYHT